MHACLEVVEAEAEAEVGVVEGVRDVDGGVRDVDGGVRDVDGGVRDVGQVSRGSRTC